MSDKKKIKILHLRSSGGLYGAEMVILTIARELEKMGCENHIVCINNLKNPHAELVDEAHHYGIKAVAVDSIGMFDWQAIKEIRRIIKDGDFDVLHFHDYKASIYGFLASYWMAPKRVVTNHLWDKIDWKVWIYQRIEGFLYNKFNRIVAVSERVKYDIRPYILHKSKIEVITNGILVEQFAQPGSSEVIGAQEGKGIGGFRAQLGLKDDDFVIGIVGRLALQKGHAYLLKAFAKLLAKDEGVRIKGQNKDNGLSKEDENSEALDALPIVPHPLSLKLLIVGDGGQERALKKLCRGPGLSFIDLRETEGLSDEHNVNMDEITVIFAGVQNNMTAVYPVLDVLAMPSLQEGLPMVLLEAMASRVPVIATPVGQISQIVEDGETGFVVQPRDVEGLLAALEKVIALQGTQELDAIIDKAFELIKENHSSCAMAKKYLETYEWLVE